MDKTIDEQEAATLCAYCFGDRGLRNLAMRFQNETRSCPNCGTRSNHVLTPTQLMELSHQFFVRGSTIVTDFGGAPAIQFNESQAGSLNPDPALAADVHLLQTKLGIGFFHYGPRLWMLGYITPLEHLQDSDRREAVIERIMAEYPVAELLPGDEFYRVRKEPTRPADPFEYDAPPKSVAGRGRLDNIKNPVLYGSQDVEICVHECRFSAGDELYIATLNPKRPLKLLDVSAILKENDTEFESLDLAVLMTFMAGSNAYPITRDIAAVAARHGFDGLIYPSYFSVLHTGTIPFETAYGLSLRRFDAAAEYERSKVIGNLAVFGRPISDGLIEVVGINRLVITQVSYGLTFGPVTY